MESLSARLRPGRRTAATTPERVAVKEWRVVQEAVLQHRDAPPKQPPAMPTPARPSPPRKAPAPAPKPSQATAAARAAAAARSRAAMLRDGGGSSSEEDDERPVARREMRGGEGLRDARRALLANEGSEPAVAHREPV